MGNRIWFGLSLSKDLLGPFDKLRVNGFFAKRQVHHTPFGLSLSKPVLSLSKGRATPFYGLRANDFL